MDIPSHLGKYPVVGVLGRGAMGVVYRGYDPLIRRPLAIKTILREFPRGESNANEVVSRFRKEAQAAGGLNHPGIVQVYDYGETDEYTYIVMEYVEGTSLREFLSRGTRFLEPDVVSLMAQLLSALGFAHANKVIHRDVKPTNIMVMSDGRLKLADFGIARLESADRTQTNVNLILGTPGYIAPEYYFNQPIDHRVDLYAAGVVLYELLSGRVPFSGPPPAVMRGVCYEEPPAPSTVSTQRSWPQYDGIVARALRKRPDNRFSTAEEFRAALIAEYKQPAPDTAVTTIQSLKEGDTNPAPTTAPPTAPTGWDSAALNQVRLELARLIGPIARVLVQQAARETRDLESLARRLSEHVEFTDQRAPFIRRVLEATDPRHAQSTSDSGSKGTKPPASAPAPLNTGAPATAKEATPADVQELTQRLTTHIGPLARVIVRRMQVRGLTRDELFRKAAQALDDEGVRSRFMRDAGL